MADTVKVGPWGASGGQRCDINDGSRPQRLETIIISWDSGNTRIIGFSFAYIDQNKKQIQVGPWGQIDMEHAEAIQMTPGEQLNYVSGTFDSSAGVTSLMLKTNKFVHGPYGWPAGPAFSVPLRQSEGQVVAFFGHSNDTLSALGVYALEENGLPVMIGPWGGSSDKYINPPVQLKSITVHSTHRIHGISFTYVDQNDDPIDVGPWGTTDKPPQTFSMKQGEYVNNITGTADANGVTSLELTTNKGQRQLYGRGLGTAFSVPLPDNAVVGKHNGAVLGFFGRSGNSLLSLGVYVGVAPNP